MISSKFLFVCIVLILAVFITPLFSQSPSQLYQQGLLKENGEGDLKAAVAIYVKIVGDETADRSLRAKAQLHIGICWEKMGKDEAQKAYKKVIQKFADQQEMVTEARVRLTKLDQSAGVTEPSGIVVRKVWVDPAMVDINGATSPDGRYLSYVDWETGGDIAICELATGNKRRLTNKSSWDKSDEHAQFNSRWSPDGKQIVYQWYNGKGYNDLRIIGLDGSKPRILYSNKEVNWTHAYDWSLDGKQILAFFEKKEGTGWITQIVLVSTANGSVRVLKTFDGSWPENMCFSPGGQYIVYDFPQKAGAKERDIFLLSTDGSREIPLVEHPSHDVLLGRAPDGKNIIFASDRNGTFSLWIMQVSKGKPQGTPKLVKSSMGPIKPLGFTRKGSFYYGISQKKNNIYIAELDSETGEILAPPKRAITRFEGYNQTPVYSPDGKYLAYISRRFPLNIFPDYTIAQIGGNALCIKSLETGKEREILPDLDRFSFPRWSPDGHSIIVSDMESGAGYNQIDIQTGNVTPVLQSNDIVGFSEYIYSPDGKTIFYVRSDREAKIDQILVRDIESGTEKEIYRSDTPLKISLSPDGQWLAIQAHFFMSEKKPRLNIIPSAGGEPRELCRFEEGIDIHAGAPFTWTADGKYILFAMKPSKKDDPKGELYRIAAKGGEVERLGLEMSGFIINLSAHPDGRHIAFSSSEHPVAEIWVMENFLHDFEAGVVKREEEEFNIRRIWAGSGVDAYGTPSSDGRYLSHTEWKNGDLAIRELTTGATEILTETKKGGKKDFRFALNSVISPDNKHVAFSWTNQYGTYDLCVIGIDGSGDRTLYSSKDHELYPACWSSDGKLIAARKLNSKSGYLEIISVSIVDGSVQVLKTSDKPYWSQFCYSPSDEFFVFDFPEEANSGNLDIILLNTQNRKEIPLVKHPANDKLLGWVPNRETVLFLSDRSGTYDIWAVKVNSGKPHGPPRVIARDVGQISPRGITQAGSFFFNRFKRKFTAEIIPFDLKTGKIHDESKMPLLGSNYSPEWSPDGESLTFVNEIDEKSYLHIRNLKTGEERMLASDFAIRTPRWSPDGRLILFTGMDRRKQDQLQLDYNGGIYKIDVQNGQVTELVKFPPLDEWSRNIWTSSVSEWVDDGRALFYTYCGRIIRRELDTGREKELYKTENLARTLDLSPDNKRLVFATELRHKGKINILTIPVSGGSPTELYESQESEGGILVPRQLTWTPDGNYILFAKNEKKGSSVCRLSSAGGDPEVIWNSENRVSGLSVHHNGKQIVVSTFLQEQTIWVMENFLPEN